MISQTSYVVPRYSLSNDLLCVEFGLGSISGFCLIHIHNPSPKRIVAERNTVKFFRFKVFLFFFMIVILFFIAFCLAKAKAD